MPEDVAGVVDFLVVTRGSVAVEDRPAEGDMRIADAVRADRHVPAGQDSRSRNRIAFSLLLLFLS